MSREINQDEQIKRTIGKDFVEGEKDGITEKLAGMSQIVREGFVGHPLFPNLPEKVADWQLKSVGYIQQRILALREEQLRQTYEGIERIPTTDRELLAEFLKNHTPNIPAINKFLAKVAGSDNSHGMRMDDVKVEEEHWLKRLDLVKNIAGIETRTYAVTQKENES